MRRDGKGGSTMAYYTRTDGRYHPLGGNLFLLFIGVVGKGAIPGGRGAAKTSRLLVGWVKGLSG